MKKFLFLMGFCILTASGCTTSSSSSSNSSVMATCTQKGVPYANSYIIKAPAKDQEVNEMYMVFPMPFEEVFEKAKVDFADFTQEQKEQAIYELAPYVEESFAEGYELSQEDVWSKIAGENIFVIIIHTTDVPHLKRMIVGGDGPALNDTLVFAPFVEYIENNGLTCD